MPRLTTNRNPVDDPSIPSQVWETGPGFGSQFWEYFSAKEGLRGFVAFLVVLIVILVALGKLK